MKLDEIKVLAVNGATVGLSFTNIENTMRGLLLFLSIIYTLISIHKAIKKPEDGENK